MSATVSSLGLPGVKNFIAGDSALTHDQSVQVNGDFRFIVLWVSIVVFVILALLVRSLCAPFYLLLSIGISTGAAIGLTVLIFHQLLGQQIFYTTPVFAFVFLVALGEDFNILLMCRIREEVRRSGLRAGVARAVGSTGATLSNCGLIMAGTLGVLMFFDVTFLRQYRLLHCRRNPPGYIRRTSSVGTIGCLPARPLELGYVSRRRNNATPAGRRESEHVASMVGLDPSNDQNRPFFPMLATGHRGMVNW